MRRAVWILVAVVAVAGIAGAVVVLRTSSASPAYSLAEAKGALVPLSEMPARTVPITFVGGGSTVSCKSSKPSVTPLVHAQASYAERLGPKTLGPPSEIENLYEVVQVFAKGTAPQAISDARSPRCPTWRVAPLDFPRLASNQVSVQETVPNVGPIDLVYLRVNDSAIVVVSAQGPADAPNVNMAAFARKAYTRATRKLGG